EELASAKNMHVQMRHFLMAVPAHVDHQPIAGPVEFELPGHFADRAHEAGNLAFRRLGGEIVPTDIASLGYHQNMDRRLRPDVVERKSEVVLIDLVAGQFPAQDL